MDAISRTIPADKLRHLSGYVVSTCRKFNFSISDFTRIKEFLLKHNLYIT